MRVYLCLPLSGLTCNWLYAFTYAYNLAHVHFASTPIRPEISHINLTPPRTHKEETIAESVLHNTMQTLASEFKRTREPKIQKFRGGTSSGTLLVTKSWMQDRMCTSNVL